MEVLVMRKSSRKNLKALLFYIIFILLVIINSFVIVYARKPGPNEVIFYWDSNYEGESLSFSCSESVNNLSHWSIINTNQNWNDKISSLKVGENAQVTLYWDSNYEGDYKAFSGFCTTDYNISSLSNIGWNDEVTSFHVTEVPDCPTNAIIPKPGEVIVYWDSNFEGEFLSFSIYTEDSKDAYASNLSHYYAPISDQTWNDKISSLKVGEEIRVILFKDSNFHGSYITFDATDGTGSARNYIPYLSDIGWNDKISSLTMKLYQRDVGPFDVILYEHDNYEGSYLVFTYKNQHQDQNLLNLTRFRTDNQDYWNDKLSSFKVGQNVRITLYDNINCVESEPYIYIQGTERGNAYRPSLSDDGWNDRVSSIELSLSDYYQDNH
jgi:hypothetical protein